jgi:hypothetical protein
VCCVHEIAQPRANASKGNDLTKVSLKQYEELRDLWPPHWLGVLPQYVADALKPQGAGQVPRGAEGAGS